jgi:hypothetical protein
MKYADFTDPDLFLRNRNPCVAVSAYIERIILQLSDCWDPLMVPTFNTIWILTGPTHIIATEYNYTAK